MNDNQEPPRPRLRGPFETGEPPDTDSLVRLLADFGESYRIEWTAGPHESLILAAEPRSLRITAPDVTSMRAKLEREKNRRASDDL